MSFQRALYTAIEDYNYEHKRAVLENGNPNDFTEIEENIKKELSKKNFYKYEIDSIIEGLPTKEVGYKFMAYYLCRVENWVTRDELVKIIENHPKLDIDDFEDKDLDNIFAQRENIKY